MFQTSTTIIDPGNGDAIIERHTISFNGLEVVRLESSNTEIRIGLFGQEAQNRQNVFKFESDLGELAVSDPPTQAEVQAILDALKNFQGRYNDTLNNLAASTLMEL